MVNNWLKNIQRVFYPPLCLLCDARVGAAPESHGLAEVEADLCAACAADLPYLKHACAGCALPLPLDKEPGKVSLCGRCLQKRPVFEYAQAMFHYQSPIDTLILGLKFNAQLSHARLLGQLMAGRLAHSEIPQPELLVPVPLHRQRLRERGFNQSLELARHIGRILAVPVAVDICRRQRETAKQSSLPASERRRNVRNAFVCQSSLMGRHVTIVDDVMTTACTANELAQALRRAGARRVDVWVCARVSV